MKQLDNTWAKDQPRTKKQTFKPKWDKNTVVEIMEQVSQMVDFVDIQFYLVKQYDISVATAALWIEMARRVMKDVDNGLSLDEALARDKERRNKMRRKTES
jgi:hypothetical protein